MKNNINSIVFIYYFLYCKIIYACMIFRASACLARWLYKWYVTIYGFWYLLSCTKFHETSNAANFSLIIFSQDYFDRLVFYQCGLKWWRSNLAYYTTNAIKDKDRYRIYKKSGWMIHFGIKAIILKSEKGMV